VVKRTIPVSRDTVIRIGKGQFDLDKQIFTIGGESEECNRYEIRILKLISTIPGKIYSRDEILHYAWGADLFPTDRTVDNYIVKLRKKLTRCLPGETREILESVYGEGYRLNV
jgi:DNA-binding response OmpR family regulator